MQNCISFRVLLTYAIISFLTFAITKKSHTFFLLQDLSFLLQNIEQ